MALATSDRTSLWVIPEVTWGVTPGAGNITALRILSESLSANIETKVSEEIRSDRATSDLVPVGQEAGGSIEFEMSFGAYDDLIEGAMFEDFAADIAITSITTDISVVNATGKLTSTLATKFDDIVVGMSFLLKGYTANGGENNGIYTCVSKVDGQDINVLPVPPSDETSTGTEVEIHNESAVNGVTAKSFTIERRIPDATVPEYFKFPGSMISTLNLDYEFGNILKGSFELLCKDGISSTTALAGLTDVPAATGDVYNSVSNLKNIIIGGVASTQEYMKLGININNNLRGQKAIGSLPNIGVGAGSMDITGPIEIYFQDGSEFTKFSGNTAFSLSFVIEDEAGNAYAFSFPRVKYESLTVATEGKNNDLIAKGTWRALLDPTQSIMMRIDKLDSSL